jgi:HK97 family phage prohead protease
MQFKTTNHHLKQINGREVTGIFAVHGNVDDGNDRSWPGAFIKTISERGGKTRHLWQHDMSAPPIAKITGLRELSRDDLPLTVLEKAPDAMGGVEVTREYLDTPRGSEVLSGIKAGAIDEMSYAYDAVKFDFSEVDGKRVRELREIRLYETSDVHWGMNPATVGSKTALSSHLQWVCDFLVALKAGARHSGNDTELINQIASNALMLGATNIKLLDDSNDDNGKSRVTQAEPVSLFDLTQFRSDLFKLQLATI